MNTDLQAIVYKMRKELDKYDRVELDTKSGAKDFMAVDFVIEKLAPLFASQDTVVDAVYHFTHIPRDVIRDWVRDYKLVEDVEKQPSDFKPFVEVCPKCSKLGLVTDCICLTCKIRGKEKEQTNG